MPSMNHSGSDERAVGPELAFVFGDVVLEGVDELVAEHVVGRLDRPGERQHDAALRRLGDAAGAFAELPFDRVGLAEVRAARVEDQRLAAAQLVSRGASTGARTSARPGATRSGPPLPLPVVVDVEVLGLQDLEVELLVLDLVAAEVAALREGGRRRRKERTPTAERRRIDAQDGGESHGA